MGKLKVGDKFIVFHDEGGVTAHELVELDGELHYKYLISTYAPDLVGKVFGPAYTEYSDWHKLTELMEQLI